MTDIVERLLSWRTDWSGKRMADGEPPRDGLHCADLFEAAAEIERLRAAVAAEREACAKIVERDACLYRAESADALSKVGGFGMAHDMLMKASALDGAAAAIRARGDNHSPVADKPLTAPDQITD